MPDIVDRSRASELGERGELTHPLFQRRDRAHGIDRRRSVGRILSAPRIAFVLVLAIAAAYRLPGVTWGFDLGAPAYTPAHPDEGIACLNAMEKGVTEIRNNDNPAERGMMFQCLVLGLLFEPQSGLMERTRISRTYSVWCGLLTIALTALLALMLRNATAAVFAALLLATSGVNIITSFWVRGQIQNVAFFLASVLLAMRVRRSREHAAMLLFAAAAFAGAAIATRWSIALLPMLFGCAIARGPILEKLGATVAGTLLGFFGSTGFFWSPELVRTNVELQAHNLVMLYSQIGPFATGGAAAVCILAGTGLVTFLFALGFGIQRALTLRALRRDDITWGRFRLVLDSPGAIIGPPIVITFVMLCFNKAFDARYTDLFAPPLAIAAGIHLSELWQKPRRQILVVALVLYQCVYAGGMASRYVYDSRKRMNAALEQVWQPRGTIYATAYTSDSERYAGYGVNPGQGPWDAEWVVTSDVYAAQYLTPSGTFPFLGAPPSCREILYCDGEQHREFIQKLYAQEGWDLVHVAPAAAWRTPEIMLHHALMTSKWMFTGDVRLFHRRP